MVLFSTRRAGTLCGPAGAISPRRARAPDNRCLGITRVLACEGQQSHVRGQRSVPERAARRASHGVQFVANPIRNARKDEAPARLAANHGTKSMVPTKGSRLPFEFSLLSSRFAADPICVQLCGDGNFSLCQSAGLENGAWPDRSGPSGRRDRSR